MGIIAIILTDILFLALVAFAVSLDRRVGRLEHRARRGETHGAELSKPELSERSDAEERRFSEAIASIMGYALPPEDEEGGAK